MKKLVYISMVLVCAVFVTGCAVLWLGTSVTSGIVIKRGAAETVLDKTVSQAWHAAVEVVNDMGTLRSVDEDRQIIKGKIGDTAITAYLTKIDEEETLLKIKARKYLLPDVDLAVRVINMVQSKMKE